MTTTQQTVRVYSKQNCMQCRMTERWLTERHVPFIHDNAEDDAVIEAAKFLGIMAAPIVVVQTPDPDVSGGFTDEAWGGHNPLMLDKHVQVEGAAL